ncbi:MAG: hypothetical protein IJS47_05695 [Clostridia bacterium]|nr:hypothetical protein [Clostridia bacterium]
MKKILLVIGVILMALVLGNLYLLVMEDINAKWAAQKAERLALKKEAEYETLPNLTVEISMLEYQDYLDYLEEREREKNEQKEKEEITVTVEADTAVEEEFNDEWFDYPQNCLVIGDKVIDLFVGPADQDNVDNFDVVQDAGRPGGFSTETSIVFFGHCYRSLRCLKDVKIGDIITVYNDGVAAEYKVLRSELAVMNATNTDAVAVSDGTNLLRSEMEGETARFITCTSMLPTTERWVVIAKKV